MLHLLWPNYAARVGRCAATRSRRARRAGARRSECGAASADSRLSLRLASLGYSFSFLLSFLLIFKLRFTRVETYNRCKTLTENPSESRLHVCRWWSRVSSEGWASLRRCSSAAFPTFSCATRTAPCTKIWWPSPSLRSQLEAHTAARRRSRALPRRRHPQRAHRLLCVRLLLS